MCLLGSLTDSDGDTVFSGCGTIVEDGETYAYYYPDEDTTQYLYETFPEVKTRRLGFGTLMLRC